MNSSNLNKLFWGLGLFLIFIIFSSVKFQESKSNNYKIIQAKYVDAGLNTGLSKSQSVVYDTSGERRNDMSKSDEKDTSGLTAKFQKNAKDLSLTLMKKLNLSLDQTSDVSNALVDYQKDLYDAREKNLSDNRNSDNNRNNEMTGSRNKNLINAYRDADKKTNDKIEKILTKEQTKKYLDVKNSWWREVKDKVYDREMKRSHNRLEGKKNNSDTKNK